MNHDIGIGVIGMGWMGYGAQPPYRQIANRFPDCGHPAPSRDLR